MSSKTKVSALRVVPQGTIPAGYARARRAYPDLTYTRNGKVLQKDQKKKTVKQMRRFLKRFTYTGTANGEADRVEFTLVNSDWRWVRAWMPREKDKVTAAIVMKHWKKSQKSKQFQCGVFLVDNVGMEGPELTCTVGATSIPETSSFRATERRKSWKKVTLNEVAKKVAARYKMRLVFDGPDIPVGAVEQDGQTDCAFLTNLCREYAYGIKMYKGKLIIYSREKYEKKEAVGTITRGMLLDFNFETNLCGTYTGAKIKYTSSSSDKETAIKVGKGNRWLVVPGDADSVSQAKRKALAALNTENEKATTLTVTMAGNTRFNETDTVKVQGLYRLNGKYFVDEVVHSLDPESGFTTKLSMHKVRKRVER